MKNDYWKKLKDPRWQKKRLAILERDKWRCLCCDEEERELQVHHLHYGDDPWAVSDALLVTVCDECHAVLSKKATRLNERIISFLLLRALWMAGLEISLWAFYERIGRQLEMIQGADSSFVVRLDQHEDELDEIIHSAKEAEE
jgi:hypothetical protein